MLEFMYVSDAETRKSRPGSERMRTLASASDDIGSRDRVTATGFGPCQWLEWVAFNASLGFVASPHETRCDPSLPQIAVALTGVSGVPGRRRSEPVGT